MSNKATLKLTFSTDSGYQESINIPNAIETLSNEDINAAMDDIITANALNTKGGNLFNKIGAVLTSTSSTEYSME